MREWAVAGSIVETRDTLLLVENLRRGGARDWSPPGGVVDPGEETIEALTREVTEETGLVVTTWSELVYEIDVRFIDLEWHLRVESYRAEAWQGELAVDDPDGIVVQAQFCAPDDALVLLAGAPRWVADPLTEWIDDRWLGARRFAFEVLGTEKEAMSVRRLR